MKTTANFIKLKGIKTPNLDEPKGKRYYDVMRSIRYKEMRKRTERNNAIRKLKALEKQLDDINEQIVMTDDPDETHELIESKREIQNNIDYHKVLSDIDLNNYANKLMQDN